MTRTVLGIDTGGTFTDFVAITDERVTVHKLPSTPEDPAAAAAEGAALVPLGEDDAVAHGTTVATNALLERRGARTALVTTEGFEDVLEIGRQARRELYDLAYRAPAPLVPRELRLGLAERVDAAGNVLRTPSPDEIDDIAARVRALKPEAVAISLLFAFLQPEHERMLSEALADAAPFVTTSSEVLPEFREYERTSAVVVNAYVGPLMSGYLDRLRERLGRPMRVMQSSGGAISVDLARRQPVRTVLSGPAGGVIGAAYVAGAAGFDQIITLDMGGTSTDVSLCPGRVQAATGFEVDGLPVGVPVIDIRTVGAGGGSIARLDAGGALRVGPESAGASPGPACYGLGDLPTVTDANLLLGRMAPERFLDGRVAINPRRSREAIERLAAGMGADGRQAALGIVRIANAVMERALRTVSLERGHDPRDFTLVAFGGAGPQHACELAAGLGIERVLVPRHAGVLSAMGVAIAEVVKDYSRTVMARSSAEMDRLRHTMEELEQLARAELSASEPGDAVMRRSLDVRYRGQSFELPVDWPSDGSYASLEAAFHEAHRVQFGYADAGAPVEVVTARLAAAVPGLRPNLVAETPHDRLRQSGETREVWFDTGPERTAVFDRESLAPGDRFDGPALVTQMDATTLVPPGWSARVDGFRNLMVSPRGAGA